MSIVCWLILLNLFEVFSYIWTLNTQCKEFAIILGDSSRVQFKQKKWVFLWIFTNIFNFSCAEIHELLSLRWSTWVNCWSTYCLYELLSSFLPCLLKYPENKAFPKQTKVSKSCKMSPWKWCASKHSELVDLVQMNFTVGRQKMSEMFRKYQSKSICFLCMGCICMSVCEIQRERKREREWCPILRTIEADV